MRITVGLVLLMLLLTTGCGPWAHSDVPVTDRIRWTEGQEKINITDFKVEAMGGTDFGLAIFEPNRALVRMHIIGTLEDERGLLPYIGQVLIGESLEEPRTNGNDTVDVIVTPLLDEHWFSQPPLVNGQKSLQVGPIPFDVKIETVIDTYQDGSNRYVFKCGEFERVIGLHQGM